MDVRVGLWRRLSTEELILLNSGVGDAVHTAYIFSCEDGPVLLSGCWLNTIFKFCLSVSWKSWPEKIGWHKTIWKNSAIKQWEARLPNGRLGIQRWLGADLPMCPQHCQRHWKVLSKQSHVIRGQSLIFFWNAGKTASEYFKSINIILAILSEE